VELSRHAKNYLRRLGASIEEVERAIEEPIDFDRDWKGKPRYTTEIRGVRVRIVLALDEPDFVVTIHDRRN
jgi:mRNA-degrading endonuclease RelE of RelBE toxin-antitoxin system